MGKPKKTAAAELAADDAPAPEPWTITIDGVTHPLQMTLEALLAIELLTGQPLFKHVSAASSRSIGLNTLATILRALLGPECADPALRGFDFHRTGALAPGLPPYTLVPDMTGNEAALKAIVRRGIIATMAELMVPIHYALRGGVTDAGDPKPGFSLED